MKYMTLALVVAALLLSAEASPPYPMQFSTTQGDGEHMGVNMRLYGDPCYHYAVVESMTTYYPAVVDPQDGNFYYAMLQNGQYVPSQYKVGTYLPEDIENDKLLDPEIKEDSAVITEKYETDGYCKWKSSNNFKGKAPPASVKNLVVPFRFHDHSSRAIPVEALEKDVFNDPTDSVKHYFESQSFGKFAIANDMAPLVDIGSTEATCADGVSATSKKIHTCLVEALAKVEESSSFVLSDYDFVTFVHSGYGAEFGTRDPEDSLYSDRIWSHQWEVTVGDVTIPYALSSAFYGTSDAHLAKMCILCHETGQNLGLPVQYGPTPGFGLGNWDVMSDPFGFAGTCHKPGQLGCYSRILLGWANVVEITDAGTYTAEASYKTDEVYVIKKGFPAGQFLCIENRYPGGYDAGLRGPGLAVYKVDPGANNKPSYPAGDAGPGYGDFPKDHLIVQLEQADGRHDLEAMEDEGDVTDTFEKDENNGVTPQGPLVGGVLDTGRKYPNTMGYAADGKFIDTGVEIKDISAPGETMSFTVSFAETTT